MADFKLMMARFPGGGVERKESSGYYMNLLHGPLRRARHLDYDGIVPWEKSDTPIDMVRNAMAWDALYQDKVDYVLMIDNDMAPDQYYPGSKPFWDVAWEWMLAHRDVPGMIAAPYCGPPPFENVYTFTWSRRQSDAPDGGFVYALDQHSRDHAAQMGGVSEVAALPTGLMLVDVRVFSVMEEAGMIPWFAYEWTDKYRRAKASTEDVFFTRNASLVGCPCWCAWDSWAEHVKTKKVGRPTLFGPEDVRDSRYLASTRPKLDERVQRLDPEAFNRAAAMAEKKAIRAGLKNKEGLAPQEREWEDEKPRMGGVH